MFHLIDGSNGYPKVETMTNSKMGNKLLKDDSNIFEETGVKIKNHHLYKWGIIVGICKDLQISQQIALNHSACKDKWLQLTSSEAPHSVKDLCIHCFIGTYAPWNPGITDNDFWAQVTFICQQSPYSWTLAGNVNAMVLMLEHLTGGQDARCQYLWFLHQSDGQNLWMLNLNRTHDHNWTCRARGSNAGGNIIHHVVLTNNGFSNAEIQVANQPSDYVPMMDHHTVVGFMNIHPPDLAVSQIKSSNDIAMGHNRPQLWYPQRSEKHKFENFHTIVNKEIRAKSTHDPPAICDESFILQYNTLTKIFKECSDTMFCRIRRDKKAINQFVMSPRIQKIQSDIRHINGAVQMTQEHFSVEVSQISIMVYHRYLIKFQTEPDNSANFHSFLISQRRTLYKTLYNERMS